MKVFISKILTARLLFLPCNWIRRKALMNYLIFCYKQSYFVYHDSYYTLLRIPFTKLCLKMTIKIQWYNEF